MSSKIDFLKPRIFIVEDDIIISSTISQMLLNLGYEVVGVETNGESSIDRISELRPNLILMDVSIQGGIDGIETALIIKSKLQIPVVFITSNTEKETIQRAKEANPFGYLVKPVSSKELNVAIEISLNNFALENKLKENEKWLYTTLKSISDGLIAVNNQNEIIFVNPSALLLLNIKTEIQGKQINEVYEPHHVNNQVIEKEERMINLNTMYEEVFLIQKESNQKIYIEETIQPILDDAGKNLGRLIIIKDISFKIYLQKKIHKKINYEMSVSDLARSLILPLSETNNIHILIRKLNKNLNINNTVLFKVNKYNNSIKISVSEYFAEKLNPSLDAPNFSDYIKAKLIELKDFGVIFKSSVNFSDLEKLIFSNREVKSFILIPLKIEDEIDSIMLFEYDISIIFDEDDIELYNLIGTILSAFIERSKNESIVNNQKEYLEKLVIEKTYELSEAVIKAENASKSKSDFLANMSHELRTPLNSIIGFSKLIQLGSEYTKEKEFLSFINTAGNHLLKMLNDILDISKMESGKLTVQKRSASIFDSIQSAANILGAELIRKKITLIQPESDNTILMIDEKRIRQVFINLLSNAVKFSNEESIIEIHIRNSDLFFEVDIKDYGIGISVENQQHLFETFFQVGDVMHSENEGTGLGLSICKHIVDAHGGKISLQSEFNTGTTFTVKLPKSVSPELGNYEL